LDAHSRDFLFIFGLFFISGFAGFLPVVAGVIGYKWLIISGFFGLLLVVAIAGLLPVAGFLSEPLIKLIDLMLLMWVVWVLWFQGSYLICFSFLVLPVFFRLLQWVLGVSG
jgi:hypothetical protein